MYLTTGTISIKSETDVNILENIYDTLEASIDNVGGDDYSYHDLKEYNIEIYCMFTDDDDIVKVLKDVKPYLDKIYDVEIKQWDTEDFGNYFKVVLEDGNFVVHDGLISYDDKSSTVYTFA